MAGCGRPAGSPRGAPERERPRRRGPPARPRPCAGAAGAVAAGSGGGGPVPPPGEAEHTAAISKADLFGDDEPARTPDRTPDRTGDVAAVPPGNDQVGNDRVGDDQVGDDDQGWDDGEWDDEAHWSEGGADDGYADEDEEFGEYDEEPAGPDRRPMIALAVLAVLVVVGLVLALQAIGGIGTGGEDVTTEPTGGTTGTSSAAPSTSGTDAAPTGPVPQISGVRTLDPQGGDGENDETAPRAIDDDPSSFWKSSTYKSAEFGGLKDGLGMVVTLSAEAPVSSVTAQVSGSGGVLEVRTAPGQGLEDSQVVGTATPGSGTVTVALDEPVTTQNVILWWTELPDVSGSFRIELADVTVQ